MRGRKMELCKEEDEEEEGEIMRRRGQRDGK